MHLLVMAKSPLPGRVKTRLCPPCSPVEAAQVAAAALADTLEAVRGCDVDRRLLALEGPPGEWIPPGFDVIVQRGEGLAERLGAAWEDAGGPGLQIGMDTPQVTTAVLEDALGALDESMAGRGGTGVRSAGGETALLGLAEDGGWWAIALSKAEPMVFSGVPMSERSTGEAQRARLRSLGWSVGDLGILRDIDVMDDLVAVAATIPGSHTADVADRLVDRFATRQLPGSTRPAS